MTEPTNFEHHSTEYKSAVEASESNGQEQYRLRDEIGYADKRIAEMAFDTGVDVSNEWTAAERKPNNVELRTAEASKRLNSNGPYMEAMRDRAELQRQLNLVQLAENKNASFARDHMRWMQYETALLNAISKRG